MTKKIQLWGQQLAYVLDTFSNDEQINYSKYNEFQLQKG